MHVHPHHDRHKRRARRALGGLAMAVAASVSISAGALAQHSAEVSFPAGQYGTMVEGTVSGDAYVDYILRAKEGQKMFAELALAGTDGHGTVYFNILPPGSEGVAVYNSSINGNATTVDLTETGPWTIRIYQMGNDRDSGKTASFTLDLSIQ